jgi:hypothetical protein
MESLLFDSEDSDLKNSLLYMLDLIKVQKMYFWGLNSGQAQFYTNVNMVRMGFLSHISFYSTPWADGIIYSIDDSNSQSAELKYFIYSANNKIGGYKETHSSRKFSQIFHKNLAISVLNNTNNPYFNIGGMMYAKASEIYFYENNLENVLIELEFVEEQIICLPLFKRIIVPTENFNKLANQIMTDLSV